MAIVATQVVDRDGHAPTYGAAANGDQFVNTGREVLHIKNTGGSASTVTVNASKPCSQGSLHNASVSVPATTGDRYLGPFPLDQFAEMPTITYSQLTGVTIAVLQTP